MDYPVRRGKSASYEVADGSITVMSGPAFFDYVNSFIGSSSTVNQEFIFVHGFATPFTDSLLRTAQLVNDLKFKGAPIVFSWPSGNIYTVDKENAFWAAKHLGQFLYDVKRRTNPERMHLAAHSMGSLVLGSAMDGLALGTGAIDNVIFAAPDVNEALFSRFAEAAKIVAKRITIYVSQSDGALLASDVIQDDRVGSRVVPRPGIEVIDAADADRPRSIWGLLGHSYIFDSDKVLFDLSELINNSQRADERVGTAPAGPPGCWRLERRHPS
jgi:esterase/lipase superfamily enzyme